MYREDLSEFIGNVWRGRKAVDDRGVEMKQLDYEGREEFYRYFAMARSFLYDPVHRESPG